MYGQGVYIGVLEIVLIDSSQGPPVNCCLYSASIKNKKNRCMYELISLLNFYTFCQV